jgi:hypothetical protein
VHPERAQARFPVYDGVNTALQSVLARSAVEQPSGVKGAALYDGLDPLQRAGLFNLFAKAGETALPDGSTVWQHVGSLYRIRGDRVFADVALPLRDLVKGGVAGGKFDEVSGSLHTPPPGFCLADSFKSKEPYGNLQVTFFSSLDAPLRFRADIDIDDAAGIEHAFQVLEHWITKGATHPFDIHEILLFHQRLDPAYELLV